MAILALGKTKYYGVPDLDFKGFMELGNVIFIQNNLHGNGDV